jgi:peptide/nickel transport system substrate-binding protein
MKRSHGKIPCLMAAVACVLAALLLWPAAGAAVTDPSASPSASAEKVVLRIGWPREPDNLNPFIGWENSSFEVWALQYDFLFGFGVDEQPTLDLAAEFPTKQNGGISPDGKVWTVKLRPGVRWQDGVPLTAQDVAFTYNYSIKNELFAFGIMTIGIDRVEVVDDHTVRIVCTRPKADMERLWLPILPRHIWQDVRPGVVQSSYANRPPIVGSGPFQVVEFKKGRYVRLVRNPGYWGKQPAVDEIVFITYQNPDSMTQDLKLGAIDAAWGLPQAQFQQLSSTPGIEALSYNYRNWDYMDINCYEGAGSLGHPVLRDAAFRQALNYAVDRERICAIAWSGNAEPGTTIMTPDTWIDPDYHWQPPAGQLYTFDPVRAGQLLDQAGYIDADGNGVREYRGKDITLRLWALAGDVHGQGEGKLIAGWLGALGLHIEFSVIDEGALEDRLWNYKGDVYAPDFDLYLWDWDGYDDPGQTLATLTTVQIEAWNEPCWSNAEYDALAVEQAATLDTHARATLIHRMQQLIYEQTPWVVLTYPEHLEAYSTDRWTGWTRVMSGHGPAFYTAGNIDTYLNLKPRTAQQVSGARSVTTVLIITGALIVLGVCAWIYVRRRPRKTEEDAPEPAGKPVAKSRHKVGRLRHPHSHA